MEKRTGPGYDVEISASVSADELSFAEVPEVRSRTRGEPKGESTSGSERSGLPHGVRSGQVYEDVRVDYRLASRIPDPQGPPEADTEEE